MEASNVKKWNICFTMQAISQTINKWDVRNVTSMKGMFMNASSLTEV